MQPTNVLDPNDSSYEELLSLWADLESGLTVILGTPLNIQEFEKKVWQYDRWMQALLLQDTDTALYLLFQLATTSSAGYSASHALVCAVLCHITAKELELPTAERDSLVHAAMTMNIAMTELQDQMAELTGKPNAIQQAAVRNHATQGCLLLARLGVVDELWLDVVTAHHEDVARPGELHLMQPADRLAHILRMIDRYAAMISPRKSRSGRTVTESLRAVVTSAKGERDEVGHALVRAVGLCPPGTFVRLDNRETAVVLRRSEKPNHPLVAILQDARGEAYSQPRLHRTAISTPRVQAALSHAQAPIQLNHHTMVQLGLYAARQTRLAA
jgi:hypothetical protein